MTIRLLGLCIGFLFFGSYVGQFAWWVSIGEAPTPWHVYALYTCAGLGLALILVFTPRGKQK